MLLESPCDHARRATGLVRAARHCWDRPVPLTPLTVSYFLSFSIDMILAILICFSKLRILPSISVSHPSRVQLGRSPSSSLSADRARRVGRLQRSKRRPGGERGNRKDGDAIMWDSSSASRPTRSPAERRVRRAARVDTGDRRCARKGPLFKLGGQHTRQFGSFAKVLAAYSHLPCI